MNSVQSNSHVPTQAIIYLGVLSSQCKTLYMTSQSQGNTLAKQLSYPFANNSFAASC